MNKQEKYFCELFKINTEKIEDLHFLKLLCLICRYKYYLIDAKSVKSLKSDILSECCAIWHDRDNAQLNYIRRNFYNNVRKVFENV